MDSLSDTLASVAAQPPNVDPGLVADAVSEQFGLAGQLSPLVSERDQNFQLRTDGGDLYLAKVVSRAEPRAVGDFQIAVLERLRRRQVSGVPQVIATHNGQSCGTIRQGDESLRLRLVSWVHGTLLSDIPPTRETARTLGSKLAELAAALADLRHPGEEQVLLWDTQRAAVLRELTDLIPAREARQDVVDALQDFSERLQPRLQLLPAQAIHNDANDDNVLCDSAGRVTGLIDFGDGLRAPRVIELATAASYLRDPDDPLCFVAPLVAAYSERVPLMADEIDSIYDLLGTRLAMTITLLYWRLSARDRGDAYRQKISADDKSAAQMLRALRQFGRQRFTRGLEALV